MLWVPWYHLFPQLQRIPPLQYYRYIETSGSTSLSVEVTWLHKYLERALEDTTVEFYHPPLRST